MLSITEAYAFLDFLDLKLPALNFTMEFLLHYTSKLIDATINNLLSILQLTICQVTQQTRATTLFPWSCFHLPSLTRKLCSTQGDSYRILVLKSSLKAVRKSQHFQDLRAKTEDHKRTMHAISIQKGLCDMGNIVLVTDTYSITNQLLQTIFRSSKSAGINQTALFIFMKCCLYMISNHH